MSCGVCVTGRYNDVAGATHSSSCRLCEPGRYSDVAGATRASSCRLCEPGRYSDVAGATHASSCVQEESTLNRAWYHDIRDVRVLIGIAGLTAFVVALCVLAMLLVLIRCCQTPKLASHELPEAIGHESTGQPSSRRTRPHTQTEQQEVGTELNDEDDCVDDSAIDEGRPQPTPEPEPQPDDDCLSSEPVGASAIDLKFREAV